MENRKTEENQAVPTDGAPPPVEVKADLPVVESPSISPAEPEPKSEPVAVEPSVAAAPAVESAPLVEPVAAMAAPEPVVEPAPHPRFVFRPRHKRYALLAASVTIAAALGAVLGALAVGGFADKPGVGVAGLEERKAMQQSISHLTKEITALKSNVAAVNKTAQTQIAKISDKLNREAAEVTGSITAPQTVPTATAAPLPTPRPAPRVAAVETPPPPRTPVVHGWSIRDSYDGYVYVEGRGEIYQVTPGAPLPGLGPVEQIKRQDGRWVVVTPKGIIVSLRDRRYFE